MTAHDIFTDSRVARVRELKTEINRLNEELARTRAELEGLRAHFALALAAARDAETLPEGGRLAIVDGWNALLGSASLLTSAERPLDSPRKRDILRAHVRAWLDAHPLDRAWIVFDGAQAGGETEGRLRVSFTGGEGPHRADRLICDYLRMCRYTGAVHRIHVFTEDTDFRRTATALGGTVHAIHELLSAG